MMINIEVSDQIINDTIITAFEGGSNYWIDTIRLYDREGKRVIGFTSCDNNPVLTLASIIIVGEEEGTEHTLLMPPTQQLEKGLKIMADKYPRHFADMLSENGDCVTADVFVQCCIFGETVYG